MIEIVKRLPCPTCGGTSKRFAGELSIGDCHACSGTGDRYRVLATFADAAALRAAIDDAFFVFGGIDSYIMTESMKEEVIGTIEERLGLSDDQG